MLQRPKVLYNTNTHQYVITMRPDDDLDYHCPHVAVATCDTADSNNTCQRDFEPLNHHGRDIGQFVDDDTASLLFEDRPNGFHIEKLSDDYLEVASDAYLITNHVWLRCF